MADDLFARAKGPRREVDGDYHLPCPWCGADNGDLTADQNDDGSSTCAECGKEFVCPDERGDLVCVGLLSPADVKYLAAREAQGSPSHD
jgi:hypothetical protein